MSGWNWLAENYWPWVLLAFVLGAIITWLLLVRRHEVHTVHLSGDAGDADGATAEICADTAIGGDASIIWPEPEATVLAPEPMAEAEPWAAQGPPVEAEPATFLPESPTEPETEPEPEPWTAPEPERGTEPEPEPVPARAVPVAVGAAAPLADGSAPDAEYGIKGTTESMIFHTEDSPYFGRTTADVWFDTESNARMAGFTRWDERGPVEPVVVPEGPYGAGSVEAAADGGSPSAEYGIKGNIDSMVFHTDDSPYFGRTTAEVWFDSESSARAAGFTRWDER